MSDAALVVFDIDGTLFQTELVTVPAVRQTFAAHGLHVPDDAAILSFFGKPVEDYLEWLASLCPKDRTAEIVDATNRCELDMIGQEGRLYPGALEALTELRDAGYRMAICSNGPEDYVAEFLDAHRVRPFFDVVRTRGARRDGKEAMLREIMEIVGARPAIVAGDRGDDISAAHANGALAIAALYGFGTDEELRDADASVTRAGDIPAAVRRLLSS